MKRENIKISLITVNYNGFEITKNCINSMLENSGKISYEIIVVDSASTDGSLEKLRNTFRGYKKIVFVPKKVNEFLAAAYNDGFKKSKGDIIVFMNNDLLFEKDWLNHLKSALDSPCVGIAGVSLLSAQDRRKIDTIGGKINYLGFGNRIDTGKKYNPNGKFKEVFFVPGSLIAIKRELFKKIGKFDEKFLGNYEDVDLAWRVRLTGLKVLVAEKSVVYHLGSWSVGRYLGNVNSSYLCRKNRLATLIKNCGTLYLTVLLPLYLTIQTTIFIKELLLERKPLLALTIPRSLYWNLANLGYLLKKRRASQKIRCVSDLKILSQMNII